MYHDCIDYYTKVDAVLILTCDILALLKITWFRIYADNLINNFNSVINDYLTIDDEEKRLVMRRHAFMGRAICYSVACVSYVASGFYMSLPLLVDNNVIRINGSVVGYAAKYPVPSICTLGSLPIPTTLHVVLFLTQCSVLIIICSGNLGNEPVPGALIQFARNTVY